MPERRGFRFALEVVFLAALAAALSFTELRPVAVAGLMLLGWLIVTLFEWVTEREKPQVDHHAAPVWHGYPASDHHDDAPTRIAWPALRAEAVGAWPVPVPMTDHASHDVAQPEFDPIQLLAPHVEPAEDEPDLVLEPERAVRVVATTRLERHRIDPLRAVERNRVPWRRSGVDEADVVTVPVRPDGLRILPLRLQRGD